MSRANRHRRADRGPCPARARRRGTLPGAVRGVVVIGYRILTTFCHISPPISYLR